MRPLSIYLIGISIYLEYDSFPDDFGRFRRFFLNGNGWTYRHTDIRTDRPSYRDARTHLKRENKKLMFQISKTSPKMIMTVLCISSSVLKEEEGALITGGR